MAREFKVRFNNVEMIEGMDGLLENTQVTKVEFEGENDLKSLKNTFKDCKNLTAIEGDINLENVEEIDSMLEGVPAIDVNLANVVKLKSMDNALTTAKTIVIRGDSYKKETLQNLLATLDWLSEQYSFDGFVGENVYEVNDKKNGENEIYIEDSLELRNQGLEILGETYDNKIRKGKGSYGVSDYQEYEIEENVNEMTVEKTEKVIIKEIKGNTYHNLLENNIANKLVEKKEYKMNYGETTFANSNKEELIDIVEIQGATFRNLNNNTNKTRQTNEYYYVEITEENNSFETILDTVEINEILGNTINDSHTGELNVTEDGFPILDENGNRTYIIKINLQTTKGSVKKRMVLPMVLKKKDNIVDKLYWNYEKECYYIEKNIDDDMSILTEAQKIELPTLNKKITLNPSGHSSISTNGVFPSSIKITNRQVAYSVEGVEENKTYSVQFKASGSQGDSNIVNNLEDIGLTIDKKKNTNNSDIVAGNNSITLDGNKQGVDESYISINFKKIFLNITEENWNFSCNFSVNSIGENQLMRLQCGNNDNEGFTIDTKPFVGAGNISIAYNNTNKKYTITIQGAMTHKSEDVSFATNVENLFEIFVKNCKITFTNIILKSGEKVYIGEGETRGKRLNRLDFVFEDVVMKFLPSEKGYVHYNIPLSITTISKNNYFEFVGGNIFIKDILLIEGENVANQEYFSGIKEIGEFKNDEYLVILTSNNYDWAWDNL